MILKDLHGNILEGYSIEFHTCFMGKDKLPQGDIGNKPEEFKEIIHFRERDGVDVFITDVVDVPNKNGTIMFYGKLYKTVPKLEVGVWYKITRKNGSKGAGKYPALIRWQGEGKEGYGFDHAQKWTNIYQPNSHEWFKETVEIADEMEVTRRMKSEAMLRGFNENALIHNTENRIVGQVVAPPLFGFNKGVYQIIDERVKANGGLGIPQRRWSIMKDGVWAEVIALDKNKMFEFNTEDFAYRIEEIDNGLWIEIYHRHGELIKKATIYY